MNETKVPSREDFFAALREILTAAKNNGVQDVTVRAGDFHTEVGGYPNKGNHRMPICCSVMRAFMQYDQLVSYGEELKKPAKGDGASLTIKYTLFKPRFADQNA